MDIYLQIKQKQVQGGSHTILNTNYKKREFFLLVANNILSIISEN